VPPSSSQNSKSGSCAQTHAGTTSNVPSSAARLMRANCTARRRPFDRFRRIGSPANAARRRYWSDGVETIAILEDDDDLRALIAELFQVMLGQQCVTAGSVAQLIENGTAVLGTQLAFVDVNLGPELPTGVDAYDWLRANHYAGRIVFLTGHAHDDPLIRRARACEGVEVMQKPIAPERLLALAQKGDRDAHTPP
jgi:CheY-like chemotaxis protein